MIRSVILIAVLAMAVSFSPNARVAPKSTSALSMEFAGGLPGGAGPELKNFDPPEIFREGP